MNLKSLIVCSIFALVFVIAVTPVANAYGIATPPSPVVDFTGVPQSGAVPFVVTFTDHSVGTGGILTYTWDFGDGNVTNATVQNPVHTYMNVGRYNVSLTVNNGVRNTTTVKTGYIVVTATPVPPVADFIGSPRSGGANLIVMFTDNSTGTDPLTFSWDFGDGSAENATVQNPFHTFVNVGTYNVSLNATNSVGSNTTIKTGYITVFNVPVANFTAAPLNGTAPLTVVFTDLSTNTPTAWNWSFTNVTGNNTPVWFSTVQNPVHTFGGGNYSIVLNASNSAGYNLSEQVTFINVTAGAPINATSRIGVFRPSTHTFYLDANGNGTWNGALLDRAYNFGLTGDLPVTGDWNLDGRTDIGAFRPSTHVFHLDANGNGTWNGPVIDRAYNFGLTGDLPVSGDWNLDGRTDIGVFRPSTHTFYLDADGNGTWNGALLDRAYNFGLTGDLPVSGDWNLDGRTDIGVFRPSTHIFYLDADGNGAWNGPVIDRAYNFGLTEDLPVSGNW